MRPRIVAAPAAITLAALTIPTIAMAWPAPQPGHPACIPVGDGTYTIVQDAQPPFPKGSHQPEHGTCEGPVVQPPAPAPTPTPAPAPAPVVIVQQVPVPVPTPVPAPVCVSGRKQQIVLARYARTSSRTSRVLERSRIRSATLTFTKAKFPGDTVGQRVTVNFKAKRVHGAQRLVATADWSGIEALRGQVFHASIRARLANGRTVKLGRTYRLCVPTPGGDGDLNEPSDLRRD